MRYRYGSFTEADAAALNGGRVTVTTHPDEERDQPGETVGPFYALHVGCKPYLMLFAAPLAADEEIPTPDHVVFLADIASVEITPEGEAS